MHQVFRKYLCKEITLIFSELFQHQILHIVKQKSQELSEENKIKYIHKAKVLMDEG